MKFSICLTLSIVAIGLHSGFVTRARAADHAEAPLIRAGLERAARKAEFGVGATNILVTDNLDFGIALADDLDEMTREDLARGVDVGIVAAVESDSDFDVDLEPGMYVVNVTLGDASVIALTPINGGEPVLLPATVSPDPHPERGPRSFVASDGFELEFGVYVLGILISPEAP